MGSIIYKDGKIIHVKSEREPETKPEAATTQEDEPKLTRREQKRQRREAAQRDQEGD